MTSNNADWERGWFYLRNDEPGLPPWTGKVVREKADSWWHDLSPSSRQDWLDSALRALKALADAGLTAASVLANLHHRRILSLMERRLRIFEMEETLTLWRWRSRGCCPISSCGSMPPRGRGAPSTSRP
jgi:hypothetical protein